jgi:hypothetical protein
MADEGREGICVRVATKKVLKRAAVPDALAPRASGPLRLTRGLGRDQALAPAALDICAIQAAARRSISAGATSSTCWARPQAWPKGSRTLA